MKHNPYADMLALPHHVSPTRPRMSRHDRAAQFAPFAALTGHSDAIAETARLTDMQADLDESQRNLLNRKLQQLLRTTPAPEVTILWFQPDEKKSGGAYLQTTGFIKKADPYRCTLLMTDQTEIPIEQIYAIESAVFQNELF